MVNSISSRNAVPASLESLLEKRWSNFRKTLRRCRKDFSERTVHALRVEIRRILSALALLEAVIQDKRIAQLRDGLKGLLKAFSRLRDIQVEMAFLKQAATD